MKKTEPTKISKGIKKLLVPLTLAAMLLAAFLFVFYKYGAYNTKKVNMETFLADSVPDAELSYLPNEDKTQADKNVSLNNDALLEQMRKDLESITAYLEELKETVEKNQDELKQYTDSSEQVLTDEVKQLMEQLYEVSDRITGTQNDITEVLTEITHINSSQMETVLEKFTDINTSLVNINVSVDTAHEELKKAIGTVKTQGEENHKELLSILEELNASFSQENTSNFGSLLVSLQTQTDTLKTQFESINTNMSDGFRQLGDNVTNVNQGVFDTKTEVLESLQKIDSNADQNYNSVALAIAGSKTEVLQKLEAVSATDRENCASVKQEIADSREAVIERIASMESKTESALKNLDSSLQSVFQSVSDGKKLLATALLTKNVTVAGDAAFVEMQQAILAIPQKIVIGVEQVPGEIEYTYHYHTGDSANGGGCYTTQLYHQHSAGCYTKATCRPFCLGLTHASRNDHWDVHENTRFMHPDCGMGIIYRSPKHFVGDPCNCDQISSHTYDKLSCGKTNATPEGWAPGCGCVDGQIVEVRIVYNTDAAGNTNYLLQSQEYIPQIYEDDTAVSSPASAEKGKETEEGVEEKTEEEKASEEKASEKEATEEKAAEKEAAEKEATEEEGSEEKGTGQDVTEQEEIKQEVKEPEVTEQEVTEDPAETGQRAETEASY